jgi:phenylalanyl-tRNA synthetase beta chain
MKISLNWLRQYVDYDGSPAALAELLTMAGVEAEGIESRGLDLPKVVVAEILSREQHPNADRLSLCRVDDGSGAQPPRQIVCGAKNFRVGDRVPLALPGAVLPGDVHIKVGKLRGIESEGMLCSARELRLSDDAEGLLILAPDARVGAPISELFPADTILDLEITPNRSDLLSHIGLAREVRALSGKPLLPAAAVAESAGNPDAGEPGAVRVLVAEDARAACPYYTARVIDGVKVGPSPEWLRQRLEAVGLRAINNVVDVTNFVMLELGQPLHAFDAANIGAEGIEVRLAHPGEELLALDGRTYQLAPDHLVIAQRGGRAEALAGVMGGEESGVKAGTTRIILEAACFSARGIRRTSRALGLSSDASYRFERGVDPAGVLTAARRAESLLRELAGGEVGAGAEAGDLAPTHGRPPDTDQPVELRLERCRQVLGTGIPGPEVSRILESFGLQQETGDSWQVPTFRPDLRREIDLIEEVSRVYGLERIPGKTAATPAPASPVDHTYDFLIGLRRQLAGLGFQEGKSVSLVRADAATPAAPGVPLKNPLSEENVALRGSLLPGLIASASRNARLGLADLRLFELGNVFAPNLPMGTTEPSMLALLLTGAVAPHTWRNGSGSRPADLYDLRAVLDRIAAPARLEFVAGSEPVAPGIAVELEVRHEGARLGRVAQIAPAAARGLELRSAVWVAELAAGGLAAIAGGGRAFAMPPRFPSVTRDLAVVAGRSQAHGEIAQALLGAGEPLLASVELFDVFTDDRGEKIAADKKSLAYSLTYRAEDRTLRAEEVGAAHGRLKTVLQSAFQGLQFRE